jgi:hypothetical protein
LGAICCFPARLKQLCRTLPRWLVGAFGILIAISLWQIFRHWNHYLLADMGFTLMYAVLPLFGLVFRKELIRYLPVQMTAFWGLNLIANLLQIYYYKTLPFGIPSNINWNAALILFSGAGAVYWIYSVLKKQKVMAGCLTALISAISFWLIFQCSCRALIPGLTGAVILALLIYLPSAKWKRAVGLMILASLAVGAVAFYKYAKNPETRKKILVDDRVFLAVTTPDMIMAAPMFGHGTPSFEQQFLPYYRQDAFFFLKHAPDRIDHPHNDILFVAAGYGLLGLLCIYGIIFYAIYTAYRNYHNEKENYAKILGRVCMDQLMVDVTDIPGVTLDDTVTLVGRDGNEIITVEQIAAAADSFNYEFVCGISRRVPRIYCQGGKEVRSVHYLLDT